MSSTKLLGFAFLLVQICSSLFFFPYYSVEGDEIARLGVISHELGHFFNLPDLYDKNGRGRGLGNYCLMANSWGWDGEQNPGGTFSCWAKIQMGWIQPITPS